MEKENIAVGLDIGFVNARKKDFQEVGVGGK